MDRPPILRREGGCVGVLGELVAKTQHDPSPEQRLSARTAAVPGGLALLHLSQLAPLVRAKANPGPSRTVAHHHGPASGLGRGGVPPSAHTTTILAEEAAPVTGDPSEGPLTPPIEQRDELRRARSGPRRPCGVTAAVGTGRRCPATWTRCSRLAFHRVLADRRLPHAISPVLHRGCRYGSWPQRWKPHSRLAVLPARLLKIAAKPD